jgi:rhodanese-related sulfurtransferase
VRKLLLSLCAALVASPAFAGEPAAAPLAQVTPKVLELRLGDPGVVVLDVRTAEEFAAGHVPGAVNLPHDQVESRLAELADAKDKEVVLYCRSGRRAQMAADVLAKAGFTRLSHLEGDYPGWSEAGLPVEAAAPSPKP